jgi:hypothetical protein
MACDRMAVLDRELIGAVGVLGGICATDPNRLHRYKQLTRTGLGDLHLLDAKIAPTT